MDSCADQCSTGPSMVVFPSAVTWALLLEASGDSESDDLVAAASIDDGDAESCSGGGGDDAGLEELDAVGTRLVSWGRCWMMESVSVVMVGAESACCPAPLSTEDTRDAEADRLFWEACIAHGY